MACPAPDPDLGGPPPHLSTLLRIDARGALFGADVRTLADLARVLRELRRRHARRHGGAAPTYRELAATTGWSHGIIGEYLAGRVLPPTDRFDVLVRLLGATPAEQGALATARDRVEESRRPTESVPVPRQLPLDVFGFTGRADQLAALDALLAPDGRTVAVISAVAGTAGVGKTALAIRWAHRVADRFPDGQLYVDLRGYDPDRPVSPAEALAGFLRGLGIKDVPGDMAERAAHYRTALAGRRVLVVLDNASGPDQVRALLPGTPSCRTVVTSRDDLTGLVVRDGARRVALDVLPTTDAVALLRTLVGPSVDTDPAAAAALVDCCAGLPLALRIAAELANTDPARPLADLAASLRDEGSTLDLLDTAGDPRAAVRSVFSWSYRQLSEPAARAFGLLGRHPGRDIDGFAVAALLDVPPDRADPVLAELARAHLIEPAGRYAYRMHDLLRAYAAERAPSDAATALRRLFDHYLGTARNAVAGLFPHDTMTAAVPMPAPDAVAWLDRQRANLVAVALDENGDSAALSTVLWRYFEVGGHHEEALAVHTSAVAAARRSGTGAADALANLGGIHWWLGDFHDARSCFTQSLAGHRAAGDTSGEARALARLGVVHERLGAYPDALDCLDAARIAYRRTGNRHGEAAQLVNLGALHRRLGRYPAAADHERQAAAVFTELGDLRLAGYALGNLGAVESVLGDHEAALTHLAMAHENCCRAADPGGEASALGTMGAVYRRLARYPEALEHLHRALTISRRTGDRSLETETLNTLGETQRDLGRFDAALASHGAARTLTARTGDRYEHARALDGIAHALAGQGRPDDADRHWRAALAGYANLGVPEADAVRARLSTPRR